MPRLAPTEELLEAARSLDRMPVAEVLELIFEEDARAHRAIRSVLPQLIEAVEVLAVGLGGGGRWFNVGAGTSGRIGVLDASEVPPTFGWPRQRVEGIIAGGDRALREAGESAEDDADAAAIELGDRELGPGDAVLAISASGRTPFALGALEAAHEAGARRLALTCDPHSPLAEAAEIAIAPDVGPEVVAGSTRMKGGLVQKTCLHMLSTAVMVRLGRVEGNRMTHLAPASAKLRKRAERILCELSGVGDEEARALLRGCGGDLERALGEARRFSIRPVQAGEQTRRRS